MSARDNVRLSAPEVASDDTAILAALRQADAADVVGRLTHELDTSLWRGSRESVDLSGGQWQKLAIARTLYAVAHGRRVVVMDEPTAHLDVRAEAEFHDQVIRAVPGVTVLLISHRLSTVRHADRIVMLDRGRITESGTHDELMQRNGAYAAMFRLQRSRFAVDGLTTDSDDTDDIDIDDEEEVGSR